MENIYTIGRRPIAATYAFTFIAAVVSPPSAFLHSHSSRVASGSLRVRFVVLSLTHRFEVRFPRSNASLPQRGDSSFREEAALRSRSLNSGRRVAYCLWHRAQAPWQISMHPKTECAESLDGGRGFSFAPAYFWRPIIPPHEYRVGSFNCRERIHLANAPGQ